MEQLERKGLMSINEARTEFELPELPSVSNEYESPLEMQFADPEYTTPLNPDCLNDADYRQDLRFSMTGLSLFADGTYSWPPCSETRNPFDVEQSSKLISSDAKFLDVSFLFAFFGNMLWIGVVGLLTTGTLLSMGMTPGAAWTEFVVALLLGSLLFTAISRRRYYGRWK